jgi:SAM-dependent methyltransferase
VNVEQSSDNASESLAKYDEDALSGESADIHGSFNMWERLSHDRKMELLAALPLPELSAATVVDYGVGAWGFGCVFPRLKECRKAIGIDSSERALALSRQRSRADPKLQHAELEFATSSGYDIPLAPASVDVFFAGECVQQIEETTTFLQEVHRILRPGGVAVFTTPNRLPFVYRTAGLEWSLGYRHAALMEAEEFLGYLSQQFEVVACKGFNQSMHPGLDDAVDEVTARPWVHGCEDDMFNATGMVVMARKRSQPTPPRPQVRIEYHAHAASIGQGYRDVELTEGRHGRLIEGGGALMLDVPAHAIRCQLILWAHPWSGLADIYVDDRKVQSVDLYAHAAGCRRLSLDLRKAKTVTVVSRGERRPSSQGAEVILVRAVYALQTA